MPNGEMLFLGKPVSYWEELDRQAQPLNCDRLIHEIAELRAKVSFYESRITEMSNFKRLLEEGMAARITLNVDEFGPADSIEKVS